MLLCNEDRLRIIQGLDKGCSQDQQKKMETGSRVTTRQPNTIAAIPARVEVSNGVTGREGGGRNQHPWEDIEGFAICH